MIKQVFPQHDNSSQSHAFNIVAVQNDGFCGHTHQVNRVE